MRPHIAVTLQDLVTLQVRDGLELQRRLVRERDANVEERRPHLNVDAVVVVAVVDVERPVDKTVCKLLK